MGPSRADFRPSSGTTPADGATADRFGRLHHAGRGEPIRTLDKPTGDPFGGPSSASLRASVCHPRHVLDQAKPTLAPTLEEGRDAGTAETDEHLDRRQEVVRLVIAGAVALLAIAAVGALIDGLVTWVDVLEAALVMILGIALLIHDRLAAMI